jgi:hypothetical protein
MSVINITKFAVGLLGSMGAGTIVGTAVNVLVPAMGSMGTFKKVTVVIGTIGLSSYVGGKAGMALADEIDTVEKFVKATKEAYREAKEQIQKAKEESQHE